MSENETPSGDKINTTEKEHTQDMYNKLSNFLLAGKFIKDGFYNDIALDELGHIAKISSYFSSFMHRVRVDNMLDGNEWLIAMEKFHREQLEEEHAIIGIELEPSSNQQSAIHFLVFRPSDLKEQDTIMKVLPFLKAQGLLNEECRDNVIVMMQENAGYTL